MNPHRMRTARSAIVLLVAACQSAPSPRPPAPAPTAASAEVFAKPAAPTFERGITPRPAPPLPPVPVIEGPVALKLVFPERNQSITVRDSNFIFGSVGNGHATLTINGAPVPVAPNGTFLGYLPVPPPPSPRYELVARNGTDSARLVVPVPLPPPRVTFAGNDRLLVDSGSVSPRAVSLAPRDAAPVRVSV